MAVLVVTTISTIFILSMEDKVLAQDNNVAIQPGYLLTVNVPSHPFGTSTIGISITTENGYTDQANIPTAGNPSWTFNIPPNQGNSVQVCVNSGALSEENCHIYKTTGSSMSVSLPAISGSSGNTDIARDNTHNSNGNSDNNKSNHDDGSNNNRNNNNSNDNSHRNHHIGGTSHFNSNSDNSRSSGSHHNNAGNSTNSKGNGSASSGSHHGINTHNKEFGGGSGNQGDIFHRIGSARSDTYDSGSGNGNGGSSNHSNDGISSNVNNNNNPGVPMVQFIGPT